MRLIDAAEVARLGLTRRESEVLAWVAVGKRNAEVATILGMRPRTVGKHLERIYQKLGVETRTAAARAALDAERHRTSNGVLTAMSDDAHGRPVFAVRRRGPRTTQ